MSGDLGVASAVRRRHCQFCLALATVLSAGKAGVMDSIRAFSILGMSGLRVPSFPRTSLSARLSSSPNRLALGSDVHWQLARNPRLRAREGGGGRGG